MSDPAQARPTIRLDRWLWQARFVKTRSLAAKLVSTHGVRINGVRVEKPARQVGPDDVLTFATGPRVRVVRILACGARRGPADEARGLYQDMSPPPPDDSARPIPVAGGRPDKRDRRRFAASRPDCLD